VTTFPDQEWCVKNHRLLVGGDSTASATFFHLIFPALVGWLQAKHRINNRELISDAATDALVDYIKYPSKWNPDRCTLISYVCMAADRDLRNALEKERRRQKREVLVADVEDRHFERNVFLEGESTSEEIRDFLCILDQSVTSQSDKEFINLMLAGERSTDRFSALLGIQALSKSEQAKAVKRNKDRLKKVIERLKRRRNVHSR